MKTLFCFALIYFISFNLNAQKNVSAKFLFKMWLYIDRNNGEGGEKTDSLFKKFDQVVEINLDTVAYKLYDIDLHFYFLKLYDLNNNKFTRNLSYNRNVSSDELKNLVIPVGKFIQHYVIVISSKTGRSYRLSGFNGNDLLAFLSDFKEEYKAKHYTSLSTKKFLKEFHVPDLDFDCLFQGLKAKEIDRDKYPCLMQCSEPIGVR